MGRWEIKNKQNGVHAQVPVLEPSNGDNRLFHLHIYYHILCPNNATDWYIGHCYTIRDQSRFPYTLEGASMASFSRQWCCEYVQPHSDVFCQHLYGVSSDQQTLCDVHIHNEVVHHMAVFLHFRWILLLHLWVFLLWDEHIQASLCGVDVVVLAWPNHCQYGVCCHPNRTTTGDQWRDRQRTTLRWWEEAPWIGILLNRSRCTSHADFSRGKNYSLF